MKPTNQVMEVPRPTAQSQPPITIALDGHAGCGKSTTARRVAAALDYAFIDTGAMYRAVTLQALRLGIDPADESEIEAILPQIQLEFRPGDNGPALYLNGTAAEPYIRQPEVTAAVSQVAAILAVRKFLVAQQQALGRQGGVVMDGRDIGTVVFPNAELKVFVTASIEARAQRRLAEMAHQMPPDTALPSVDQVAAQLTQRDQLDSQRSESPLRRAEDARLLDTTDLSIDQQVDLVLEWVAEAQAARQ